MEYFTLDQSSKEEPSKYQGVVRLLHSTCEHVEFRRVPPDGDASIIEIGRDREGKYFTREPMAGNTDACHWSPAEGRAACNHCWKSQSTENEVFDLVSEEVTRE